MAKKKDDFKGMSIDELKEKLESLDKEKDSETYEKIERVLKMKEMKEKMAKKVSKQFEKLKDYKAKIKIPDKSYKDDEYIDMSSAFKETTRLNGIPLGHVNMVYGLSDSGKTTLILEVAAYAQKQGILPIFIITENKFSPVRAETMGVNLEHCIIHDNVDFIEEACDIINEHLKSQEKGELGQDIVFLWDSIGQTPSREEMEKVDKGEKGGMMLASRVINERIKRNIGPKINRSRREESPYTNTLFLVNHAYTVPPSFPGGVSTITPYGGKGLWYLCTIVFRMGGVYSSSSSVKATKDGIKVEYAIRSTMKIEKNHLTNVKTEGKIICTAHGFLVDDKKALDEYKEQYKGGWNLDFDPDWDNDSIDG